MTVLVAHAHTDEGAAAFTFALAEAARRNEDLLAFELAGHPVPEPTTIDGVAVSYRSPGADERDFAGAFLDTAEAVEVSVVVVGIRHRSPVGKMLLGSTAQQILLESSAPVIAVKA
ncbi:universal stress protein [Brevibacterium samyangense]|uniref:Universal stress protein n=1 Tax=Brevibacterium samyangense TaxID=366888 RepID=A0ABP5ESS9_9MICO